MKKKDIRHLPVIKDGQLIGIINDRDLKVAMQFPVPSDTIIEHVMVRDLYIVDSEAPIDEVAQNGSKLQVKSDSSSTVLLRFINCPD